MVLFLFSYFWLESLFSSLLNPHIITSRLALAPDCCPTAPICSLFSHIFLFSTSFFCLPTLLASPPQEHTSPNARRQGVLAPAVLISFRPASQPVGKGTKQKGTKEKQQDKTKQDSRMPATCCPLPSALCPLPSAVCLLSAVCRNARPDTNRTLQRFVPAAASRTPARASNPSLTVLVATLSPAVLLATHALPFCPCVHTLAVVLPSWAVFSCWVMSSPLATNLDPGRDWSLVLSCWQLYRILLILSSLFPPGPCSSGLPRASAFLASSLPWLLAPFLIPASYTARIPSSGMPLQQAISPSNVARCRRPRSSPPSSPFPPRQKAASAPAVAGCFGIGHRLFAE